MQSALGAVREHGYGAVGAHMCAARRGGRVCVAALPSLRRRCPASARRGCRPPSGARRGSSSPVAGGGSMRAAGGGRAALCAAGRRRGALRMGACAGYYAGWGCPVGWVPRKECCGSPHSMPWQECAGISGWRTASNMGGFKDAGREGKIYKFIYVYVKRVVCMSTERGWGGAKEKFHGTS